MTALLAVAAILVASAITNAREMKTITGEVVDVTCYTKQGEKATGDSHKDCATSCAKRGSPMGILTSDGVYTIQGSYTDNKNEKLIDWIAKKVQATGEVGEKDGKKTISVTSLKPAM
jgi:hypothetical protein